VAATVPSLACQQRTEEFQRKALPLPGSVPRDNLRPMNVALAHEGKPLHTFLTDLHPHIDSTVWQQRAREGHLHVDGRPVHDFDQPVRAGNRVVHTIAKEVEPDVSVNLRFLYEDDVLAVVSKPAPLAIHPCGRYNRNSLLPLLSHVFGAQKWHPVHRLDADTTGLLVLAKTPSAARHLGKQFEARTVKKLYLARVIGIPQTKHFSCDLQISNAPGKAGKRSAHEADAGDGQLRMPAFTAFELLATFAEGSLVSAAPSSGRTNQIRVHLAALGLPIVGDDSHATSDEFTSGRTNLCLHAWQLGFCHPQDERWLQFEDAAPAFAESNEALSPE
jgi:UPF0176 protein